MGPTSHACTLANKPIIKIFIFTKTYFTSRDKNNATNFWVHIMLACNPHCLSLMSHTSWVIANARWGIEEADLNSKMLANVLDCLIPNAPNLEHVCLQMGTEHYAGAHDISAMDLITNPDEVRDQERLPRPTNGLKFSLHDKLQDVLFEKLGGESDIKISWSINHPVVILFSFFPLTSYSSMNFLVSLIVYAAIYKKEGT